MSKILGVFLGLIALVIIGIVGVSALSNTELGPVSKVAEEAKVAAANAAFDASGVRDRIKESAADHSGEIAAATGLTTDEVDSAIKELDIDSWEAIPLPPDAVATETVDASAYGIDGTVTSYADPGYITLDAYGQNITLEVPESAHSYLPYLTDLG